MGLLFTYLQMNIHPLISKLSTKTKVRVFLFWIVCGFAGT